MENKISNESVVERVMRMGIEHRSGVPIDNLWDLAVKQLAYSNNCIRNTTPSFEKWISNSENKYAFTYIKNVLTFVNISNANNLICIGWRSNNSIPVVSNIP